MGLLSLKQLAASYVLTNIFFLLSSPASFLTLDYVRQISLGGFFLVWLLFDLILCLPRAVHCRKKIPALIPCAGLCLAVLAAGAAGNGWFL